MGRRLVCGVSYKLRSGFQRVTLCYPSVPQGALQWCRPLLRVACLYSFEYNQPVFTVKTTPEFVRWLASLKDRMTQRRLARRLEKAQEGNLGDVKPVGEGVMEMREFFGPGWRMYYVERDGAIIVMLGGGDKSSQQSDIAAAIALAATLDGEPT